MRASVGWLLCLVPLAASAGEPPALRRSPTLVVPFATTPGTPAWLGIAAAEVVLERLAQHPEATFFTLKQLDSALRRRDGKLTVEPGAQAGLLGAFGAELLISGRISCAKAQCRVEIDLRAENGTARWATLDGPPDRVPALIAGAVEPNGTAADGRALEPAVRCAMAVIRQPLGPGARVTLGAKPLAEAEALCRKAISVDPTLGVARAGLAIVLAARGRYDEAKQEAQQARETRVVPLAWLAESFAARLAGREAEADGVLAAAILRHPGFLQALGYLAESQLRSRDAKAALRTADLYLARAPKQPWALARRGEALALLGRHDEAVATVRTAAARAPDDPETAIALAERLVDSGGYEEAARVATPHATGRSPRPRALLVLGRVAIGRADPAAARKQLTRALDLAFREDEARTRAEAHAALARLDAAAKDEAGARRHLAAVAAENWPGAVDCAAAELAAVRDSAEFKAICAR